MLKLQGYVHGFIIKFLRIAMQVANAAIVLSVLQKAKNHKHTQLFVITKMYPSKTNCVFKTLGSKHVSKHILLSYFVSTGC